MNLRMAQQKDLPELRRVYQDIAEEMKRNGVDLWNEFYPYEALPGDIEANRLYLLCEGERIAAAFALEQLPDSGDVEWLEPASPAVTLMRLGVDPHFQHCGVGAECIRQAGIIARKLGGVYLRLFVVDINTPAEKFYLKCGFRRAAGNHIELIPDLCPQELTEYGYEMRL